MMYAVAIEPSDELASFRSAARKLLAAHIDPADIAWTDPGNAVLFPAQPPDIATIPTVPRSFLSLAEAVACHRDPARWSLLYQLLWRLTAGERTLMQQPHDKLVHCLQQMSATVRRDQHRMTAFVRFRIVNDDEGPCSIAWYQPQHSILRRTSPFFIDRFANLRFSILTPDLTLHWDRKQARFEAGVPKTEGPPPDAMEDWWRRYYRATFNPARANPRLLHRHMPQRFWRDMPEALSISDLLEQAETKTRRMIKN